MAANLKTELTLKDKNFSAQLNSACKKAKSSLGEISTATRGFNGLLGGLGGQLGKTIAGLSGMAGAFSALCNPITAAGAALGLAGKAFFDYNVELEKAQRLASQFTGLDGNQLSSFTNKIRAIADSTGKDFNEVLHAAEEYARTMGITFDESANLIQAGFVAGADEGGNFLQNLRDQDATLKDLGLTAEEAMAVMSQERSGLFDEKGAQALTMGLKNLGNMTKKTKQDLAAIGIDADAALQKVENGEMSMFQFLQQIAGKLKETGRNTQEYGAVLADVFGKKGPALGDGFIGTLADMTTNLDDAKAKTGEQGQVMDELINTTIEWNNACETLFGAVGSGFADFGKKAKIYVLQNLTKIINHIVDLYNKSWLVRGAVLAIMKALKSLYLVAKSVFQEMGQLVKNLAKAIEHLLEGEFSKAWDDVGNISADDNKITEALRQGLKDTWNDFSNEVKNSKIDKVTVEADVVTNTDDTKPPKPPKDPTGGKGGKGGKGDKDKKDKPAEDSLEYLEQKLKDLQDKYKKGFIKLTPEEFQKQVKDLEDQIEKKKIEMYPELDPEGLPALKKQLQKLQEDQTNGKLKLNADEYRKQVKDLEDKIEAKEIEKGLKLPPNEIEKLEKQLKTLEDNQLNVSTRLDATEYKKQHKELEQQIESEKIKWGVSLSKDDLDKEYKKLNEDFGKKSSFELAIGQPEMKTHDDKLNYIQDQMDQNDQLLEQLKEIQEEYAKLGDSGKDGYEKVSAQIADVTAKQTQLKESAKGEKDAIEQTKKLSGGFSKAGDAVGAFGDIMSNLGSSFESPELNVAGTIAQAIAQIALGAGQAIAQAGELGPWAWVAFGITAMAQLAAMISQLHSITGYASGGIVSGGRSVGDKNLVRINSGEMVLNKGQQGRLWNMINGNSTIGNHSVANGQVQFKIRGADLVGSINNYKKLSKKQ